MATSNYNNLPYTAESKEPQQQYTEAPVKSKKIVIPLKNELEKVKTFNTLEKLKQYKFYQLIPSKYVINFQTIYKYGGNYYKLLGNYTGKQTTVNEKISTDTDSITVDMTTLKFTEADVKGVIKDLSYNDKRREPIVPHNRYDNLDKMIDDIFYDPKSNPLEVFFVGGMSKIKLHKKKNTSKKNKNKLSKKHKCKRSTNKRLMHKK